MITIPDWIWDRMLDEFSHIAENVERVAFLDGVPMESGGVVTTLTIPDAELRPRYYNITGDAMSQAGKHFRAHDLVRLAQVHTHPDDWTDHSPIDNMRAYSQETDSVSIVLPFHGRTRPGLSDGVGVLVREVDGWRKLDVEEIIERVRIVPAVLNFRIVDKERNKNKR